MKFSKFHLYVWELNNYTVKISKLKQIYSKILVNQIIKHKSIFILLCSFSQSDPYFFFEWNRLDQVNLKPLLL